MADRGFDVEDILPEGVTLNIPPFMIDEPRLPEEDEAKTRKIASVRIHVERAINTKTENFPNHTQYTSSKAAEFNKIWVICCYLTNLLPPLIAEG